MPMACSAWALPLGYLGDEVIWLKFQDLAKSENSSLVKHKALSVTKVSGIPVSLNMVLKAVMTELVDTEGNGCSNTVNE